MESNFLKTMRLVYLGEIEVEIQCLEKDLAVTEESIEELRQSMGNDKNTFTKELKNYNIQWSSDALDRYSDPIKRKEAEQILSELKNDFKTLKKLWKISS